MPIHLRENPYQGINAHLRSYLQQPGDWSIFHGEYITHLREALQEQLPPETGHFVVSEKSLQVIRDDLWTGYASRRTTIPDVGIYKAGTGQITPASSAQAAPPGAVIPIRVKGDSANPSHGLNCCRLPINRRDRITRSIGRCAQRFTVSKLTTRSRSFVPRWAGTTRFRWISAQYTITRIPSILFMDCGWSIMPDCWTISRHMIEKIRRVFKTSCSVSRRQTGRRGVEWRTASTIF